MSVLKPEDETPPPRNITPAAWNMHKELPQVGVPLVAPTGEQQWVLENTLSEVKESLRETRLIRESGQKIAEMGLRMFDKVPALERRMNRVEVVAIGAIIINIVMLFVASCGHH